MSDSTPTLDFFSASPENIAEHYKFKLTCLDYNNQRYYAVLDWIKGITNHKDSHTLSTFWSLLKNRHTGLKNQCLKLPYRATDGKRYLRDYADRQTLKYIVELMGAKTGISRQLITNGVVEANESAAGFIYILGIKEHPQYFKIGKATKVHRRLENIDSAMPFAAYLVHSLPVQNRHLAEKALHHYLQTHKIKKEWFRLLPSDLEKIVALSEKEILALRNSEDVGEHAARMARRLGKDIATDSPLLEDGAE